MAVKLVRYNEVRCDEWDRLVHAIQGISFEYTSAMIDYRYACSPWAVENASFIYMVDGVPLSAAVLFLETYEGEKAFTASRDYLVAPYVTCILPFRRQEAVVSEVLKQIHELAAERGVSRIAFRLDPLSNCQYQNPLSNFNYLMKYDYQNTSINTQLIDLGKTAQDLWTDVRKGHKANIKNGQKVYEVKVLSGASVSRDEFQVYKEMHHRAAGRKTRPDETFWMMHGWIKSGNGALCIGYLEGLPVSALLATLYGDTAYYASAAEEPDIDLKVPVGHVSQWQLMLALKAMGVRYYEIGWQEFGKQGYSRPTDKEMSIAAYKRGFGGETRSLFRGSWHQDLLLEKLT